MQNNLEGEGGKEKRKDRRMGRKEENREIKRTERK